MCFPKVLFVAAFVSVFVFSCVFSRHARAEDSFLEPPQGGLSFFSWFTAISSEDEAENIFNEAQNHLLNNDYSKAASLYGRLAAYYKPGAKEAHLKAAKCHLLNGDGSRSVKWLTSYMKKYGPTGEVYHYLGEAYGLVSDYRMQVQAYERALEYDEKNPETHFHLGLAYDRLGKHNRTIHHCQRAVQLDSSYKKKLQPLIRNTSLAKEVGKIVDEVLAETNGGPLTDEQINAYARRVGEILGDEQRAQ